MHMHAARLAAGPRGVEEPADAQAWQPLSQHGGEEHEMVVVHPYHVLAPRHRRHRVGELVVGLTVGGPLLVLRRLLGALLFRVGVKVEW